MENNNLFHHEYSCDNHEEANGVFESLNCGEMIAIDCYDNEFPPCPVCENISYVRVARESSSLLDEI